MKIARDTETPLDNAPLPDAPPENDWQAQLKDIDDDLHEQVKAPDAPPDCAILFGRQMVYAGLSAADRRFPLGIYIVQAPSQAWCEIVGKVLPEIYLCQLIRPLTRRPPASNFRYKRPRTHLLAGRPDIGVCMAPASQDLNQQQAMIATATAWQAEGRSVFIVTSDPATIPQPLRALCSRNFMLPEPNAALLACAVESLTGERHKAAFYSGIHCQTLSPEVLRLAYHQGISALEYAKRLGLLTQSTFVASPKTMKPVTPLSRLHGIGEVTAWATDLRADLALWRQGALQWAEVSSAALLVGPPGTGKTTIAQAIAADCGIDFISTSFAAWQATGEGHLGTVTKAMRAAFTDARAKAPVVLFIDELDSLGQRGASTRDNSYWTAVINAFLEQTDGTTSNEGVVLIAATNHIASLDPAILRSGRLERHLVLMLPPPKALALIYKDELHATLTETTDDQYTRLGQMSAGRSGADVMTICATAKRMARREKRQFVFDDVITAIIGAQLVNDPETRKRIALHEAGHAVAVLVSPHLQLEHVSMIGSASSGGRAFFKPCQTLLTREGVDACLIAILSGRAAEDVLLGSISSGSGGPKDSDLACATELAAQAEFGFGLGDGRLIWRDVSTNELAQKVFSARPDFEQLVQERLAAAYASARQLMMKYAAQVQTLAKELASQSVLTGDQARTLVKPAIKTVTHSRSFALH